MWGSAPWSEEERVKLTMMTQVWRYCLVGLGLALLWTALVRSLHTPFWSDLAARAAAGLHLWP